ncbi:MAG TPA: glutamate--tRNA ligase, partial [Bacteroidetes bacterium]|nr:glutamate--tRNA ligase [Bacteroidota bacterium]
VRVYLDRLDQIPEKVKIFTKEKIEIPEEFKELVFNDSSKKVFEVLKNKIQSSEKITAEEFKTMLNESGKETGVKGKNLFKPVRIALTGEEHGPEMPVIAEIYGKEKLINILSSYK